MSDSSTEIQGAKETFDADYKSTLKERLRKKIHDDLSKMEIIEDFTFYNQKNEISVKTCIYRVPDQLRKVKEDAYRPSVVSIGPFHAKDPKLAPMIQYKRSYMLYFFQQSTKDAEHVVANRGVGDADAEEAEHTEEDKSAMKCLEDCIDAVDGLDEGIRLCYAEGIKYKELELAEMMLLDGCFLLELFLRSDRNLSYIKNQDYVSDPILRSAWTTSALQHDLALLENQIPYFVLEALYRKIKPHLKIKNKVPDSVASLALQFFQPMSPKAKKVESAGTEFKHLLDLLYKFYFHPTGHLPIEIGTNFDDIPRSTFKRVPSCSPSKTKGEKETPCLPGPQGDPSSNGKWEFDHCTSELLNSGIELQVGSSFQQYLPEIKFEHGVIKIPRLYIRGNTDSLLRNLIAFEQCSLRSVPIVTSYAFLLKSLITTTEDSKLLRSRNIIRFSGRIGDKECLVQFESILDEVAMEDDFYFGALFDNVDMYKSTFRLCRLIRALKRTHFSAAWSRITFIGAICAFLLSFLQTYFTINPR